MCIWMLYMCMCNSTCHYTHLPAANINVYPHKRLFYLWWGGGILTLAFRFPKVFSFYLSFSNFEIFLFLSFSNFSHKMFIVLFIIASSLALVVWLVVLQFSFPSVSICLTPISNHRNYWHYDTVSIIFLMCSIQFVQPIRPLFYHVTNQYTIPTYARKVME